MKYRNLQKLKVLLLFSLAASCKNPVGDIFRNPPLGPQEIVYISPDGSDETGTGTVDNPLKTLSYTAANLDVLSSASISLLPGTFIEQGPIRIPPGVSLRGSGMGDTVIKSDYSNGFLLVLESDAGTDGDQAITGFTIDGMDRTLFGGLWVEGRNKVTLQNIEFKEINTMGAVIIDDRIKAIPEPGKWASGIKVLDCRFENTAADLDTYSTGNLNIGGLDGALISNIEIIDDEGYGIKFYKDGYLKNTSIENCSITLSEDDDLWDEDIAIELWNLYEGNSISDTSANTWFSLVNYSFFNPLPDKINILVENCRIESLKNDSHKEGIELGAQGAVIRNNFISRKGYGLALWNSVKKNILIEGNIFRDMKEASTTWNGGSGIFIANSNNWDFDNITITNNVFDQMPTGIWFKQEMAQSTMTNLHAYNNYFGMISSKSVRLTGSVSDLNLRNNFTDSSSGVSTLLSIDSSGSIGSIVEEDNMVGDPELNETGDYWDAYYKPLPSSPLIDSGYDAGLRTFLGLNPDIGAFEVQ